MDSDDDGPNSGGFGGPDVPDDAEEMMDDVEAIKFSPTDHQRVMDLVHGDQMNRIQGHERRYLVVGAGGETGAATRRQTVYDLLDARTDPSAVATRLEDFGLTRDELRLWVRVFDILCGMATHIVGVLEDFDGGYVWELGLLFAPEYRGKAWVLKRRYPNEETEREKYENGMAISHIELLLLSDRCHEWTDAEDLPDAIEKIP